MTDALPLWISESDVVAMMDFAGAIAALERGLLAEAQCDAHNMVKTHVEWEGGATLHAIGGVFPKEGFAGTKTWAHTKGGATPLLLLFDSANGALRAVIEAFALGQMRTGAASGVATKWLAAADADDFAIVGTGKQALTQVAAVAAVRPIRRVRVFGRNQERLAAFVKRVQQELGLAVEAAASIAEAVEGASIVTAVTRATEPILTAAMLVRGAHINTVGAIVPTRVELARDVLARAGKIVADSVPQARQLSRELIDFCGDDAAAWSRVWPLAAIVAGKGRRSPDDDLTVFKSLGMGISDLALGIELYRRAVALGAGRALEHPRKIAPRLRGNQERSGTTGA
jgi:ornithine cyclodeaminase/alanine dehydrogenase-like protein (mu-crystallin family)